MSAVQVLAEARSKGIQVHLDGDNLLLEAPAPPPSAVLDALSRHKAEIVELLRPRADGWSTADWLLYFAKRAAVAEFDGGLTRADAEAQAFECCIVQWLNRNPGLSVGGRCVWCGRAETEDTVVLPFGADPGMHAWLHAECWPAWHQARRAKAVAELRVTLQSSQERSDGRDG
jgi:TubC N-terminal docking domain